MSGGSILLAAVSPRISRQMTFAASRIDTFPIVKGLFASVIWSATKYDALNAAMFIDMAALSSRSYPACCSCFCSKRSLGLSFNLGYFA